MNRHRTKRSYINQFIYNIKLKIYKPCPQSPNIIMGLSPHPYVTNKKNIFQTPKWTFQNPFLSSSGKEMVEYLEKSVNFAKSWPKLTKMAKFKMTPNGLTHIFAYFFVVGVGQISTQTTMIKIKWWDCLHNIQL